MEVLKQQLHLSTSAAESSLMDGTGWAAWKGRQKLNKTKQSQKEMIWGLQDAHFFTVISSFFLKNIISKCSAQSRIYPEFSSVGLKANNNLIPANINDLQCISQGICAGTSTFIYVQAKRALFSKSVLYD